MSPTRRSSDESGDLMDSDPNEFFDLVDILDLIEIQVTMHEEFPPEEYADEDA